MRLLSAFGVMPPPLFLIHKRRCCPLAGVPLALDPQSPAGMRVEVRGRAVCLFGMAWAGLRAGVQVSLRRSATKRAAALSRASRTGWA